MIVNIRTYTLVPRKLPTYLKLFEDVALPVMQRHGLELMGYYTSVVGPQNQLVHLWRYDSLADMERKRAARDADAGWLEFQKQTEGLVLMQEDKVMKPAPFSPGA
ncbi:MAG: NIPSNAP family protein [Hyphomicrobiaceae bacterium]